MKLMEFIEFYRHFWGYLAAGLAMSAFCYWSNTLAGCLCAGFSLGLVIANMILVYPRKSGASQ